MKLKILRDIKVLRLKEGDTPEVVVNFWSERPFNAQIFRRDATLLLELGVAQEIKYVTPQVAGVTTEGESVTPSQAVEKLRDILGKPTTSEVLSNPEKHKEVLLKAIKGANDEQRKLVDEYRKSRGKPTYAELSALYEKLDGLAWEKQGRNEEMVFGVRNFLTGLGGVAILREIEQARREELEWVAGLCERELKEHPQVYEINSIHLNILARIASLTNKK